MKIKVLAERVFPNFAMVAIIGLLLLRLVSTAVFSLHDPSESRYAVMAKNMADSGDFLVPRFVHNGLFQSFDGKPPLFFQLGGVACRLFGDNTFAVRLPSFLAGLAILFMLGYTARRLLSKRVAATALLLTALNPVFYVFIGLSLTDMLLAACVDGALFAFALACHSDKHLERLSFSLAFFACLGFGMLTKGPVAIVTAGTGLLLFTCIEKRLTVWWHQPWLTGLALFALITLPWFIQMAWINPNFFSYFFIEENVKRFIGTYHDRYGSGHVYFRGVALLWLLIVNLPAWLISGASILLQKRLPPIGAILHPDRTRVGILPPLALWCTVAITLFWMPSDKALIYYLLPTIPLVSILVAVQLESQGLLERPVWEKGLTRSLIAIGGCTALILGGVYFVTSGWGEKCPGAAFIAARELLARDGSLADKKIYFLRGSPYSAEFYLGKRVSFHPRESIEKSLEKGTRDCILAVAPEPSDAARLAPLKLLLEHGKWKFYQPFVPLAKQQATSSFAD